MAISEQLDLISKEIGGKLDDNGSIERQVQEIYDIIKSGAWPSGGGSTYELPTASTEVKGGVKVGNGLKMRGEAIGLDHVPTYKKGTGFIGEYLSDSSINDGNLITVDEDCWIAVSISSASSSAVNYAIKIKTEEDDISHTIVESVIPGQTSGTFKHLIPLKAYSQFQVSTNYGSCTVSYSTFAMDYINTMTN